MTINKSRYNNSQRWKILSSELHWLKEPSLKGAKLIDCIFLLQGESGDVGDASGRGQEKDGAAGNA